ncbi:MAG: hypothetical protein ACLQQ4_01410 [Bacteroidia bacterium]
MNKDPRIKRALDNAEAYVELMATMPDKELAKKLEIIHLQGKIAVKKKMTSSIELLEIWRSQVIAARIYKAENNIPDKPSDMEIALVEMELLIKKEEERMEALRPRKQVQGDKTEAQKEILNESVHSVIESNPKAEPQKDTDSQLSLF